MKKILLVIAALILGTVVTQAFGQTVVVQSPNSVIVVPPGQAYVTPQMQVRPYHRPPPVPPKPMFQTPLRDGLWYSGIYLNRALWYNRHWRYHRLEGLLGPTVIKPIPQE